MKAIMNKLNDYQRANDLSRPVNLDLNNNGYWERLYAAREYEDR
jgi:hypothetical protein